MDPLLIATSAVVLVIAGAVKGTLGFGLPLVAISLLAFAMPPQQAAILLLGPILTTNIWQIVSLPAAAAMTRRLALMLVATPIATYFASGILSASDTSLARIILGTTILVYALFILSGRRPRVRPRDERWMAPLVGAMTGAIGGATGVTLVPLVGYLQAIGLEKGSLIQAQSLVFLIAGVALAASLALGGHIGMVQAAESGLAIIPAGLGILIGQAFRDRLDVDGFRKVFCVALICIGLYIVATALA